MVEAGVAEDRISFLKSLRAVRFFRPDPVPQEIVDDVLEVARWTGSAENRQPWELVAIRDRQTLRTLARMEGYAEHLAGAAMGIVPVMAGEREEQEVYDEGRLSERIMLAAHAHGLGASIGWFVRDGVTATKDLLDIPEVRRVRTAISLGYPQDPLLSGRPKLQQSRKPLYEIVCEERYG